MQVGIIGFHPSQGDVNCEKVDWRMTRASNFDTVRAGRKQLPILSKEENKISYSRPSRGHGLTSGLMYDREEDIVDIKTAQSPVTITGYCIGFAIFTAGCVHFLHPLYASLGVWDSMHHVANGLRAT